MVAFRQSVVPSRHGPDDGLYLVSTANYSNAPHRGAYKEFETTNWEPTTPPNGQTSPDGDGVWGYLVIAIALSPFILYRDFLGLYT